jgi:cytochrome c oxidase assembly protein Cox11
MVVAVKTHVDEKIHSLMHFTYSTLNKKLDTLVERQLGQHVEHRATQRHQEHRVINLIDTRFTHEHLTTLNFGFQYAMEKQPKQFLNTLIVATYHIRNLIDYSMLTVVILNITPL